VFSLWDLDNKSLVSEFKHTNDLAAKCCASPDGKILATTGGKGDVFLWDVDTKTILHTLDHDLQVFEMQFSPDGRRLAAATTSKEGQPGSLSVWDVQEGTLIAKQTRSTSRFHSIDFAADGQLLVAAGGSYHYDSRQRPGEVIFWDYEKDQIRRQLNLFSGMTYELSVSRKHNLLVVAGWDNHIANGKNIFGNRIRIVDLLQGDVIRTFHCGNTVVTRLMFLPDTELLIAAGTDASIRVWDTSSTRLIARLTGHQHGFWAQATNAKQDRLASLDTGGVIKLWKLKANETQPQVQAALLEHPFVSNVRIHVDPSRKRIWTNYPEFGVTLWSEANGDPRERSYRPERIFPTPQDSSTFGFDISPDGTILATVGGPVVTADAGDKAVKDGGFVWLWDIATGQIVKKLEIQPGSIHCVSFSPDGRTLAAGGSNKDVVLWDLRSDQPWPWGTLTEHEEPVNSVAFSSDGKYLATGGGGKYPATDGEKDPLRVETTSGAAKLWKLPDDPESPGIRLVSLHTEVGPGTNGVQTLTFSPDSRTLAVSGFEETQLYSVEPWEKKFSVPGRAVTFFHDGSRFATGGDNQVSIYAAETGDVTTTIPLENSGAVFSVQFLSPTELISSYPRQQRLAVWSIETGKALDAVPKWGAR
jgi:WD40 repeat protein